MCMQELAHQHFRLCILAFYSAHIKTALLRWMYVCHSKYKCSILLLQEKDGRMRLAHVIAAYFFAVNVGHCTKQHSTKLFSRVKWQLLFESRISSVKRKISKFGKIIVCLSILNTLTIIQAIL